MIASVQLGSPRGAELSRPVALTAGAKNAVFQSTAGGTTTLGALQFIGLTSPLSEIDSAAKSVGVSLSPPVNEPDGSITVEHGAQTLAFTADKAHVVWLAGTPQGDYAHDIAALDPGPS